MILGVCVKMYLTRLENRLITDQHIHKITLENYFYNLIIYMYKFIKHKNGFIFKAPSRRKNKKYDVFTNEGNYITSFGDRRYNQFKDLIGYYKDKDHNDMRRKAFYYDRHGYYAKPLSARYFSHNFLW